MRWIDSLNKTCMIDVYVKQKAKEDLLPIHRFEASSHMETVCSDAMLSLCVWAPLGGFKMIVSCRMWLCVCVRRTAKEVCSGAMLSLFVWAPLWGFRMLVSMSYVVVCLCEKNERPRKRGLVGYLLLMEDTKLDVQRACLEPFLWQYCRLWISFNKDCEAFPS